MPNLPGEFAPWLGVFETVRVVEGRPLFFAEHRLELLRAMEALGLTSEIELAAEAAKLPAKSGRWRWVVTRDGAGTFFSEEAPLSSEAVALVIPPVRVGSANWDARFKTVSYLAHAQAAQLAGGGEAVLLNERGDVASAARGNLFWRRGDRLFTPAHEAGCRCGVVRGFVLAREKVEIGHFPLADLLAADEVILTNSMRGIVLVSRVEGRALAQPRMATALRKAYEDEIARQLG